MKKLFYLLCLMLFSLFIGTYAQSPGGVHGTEVWFMTESVTDSLNGQYHWADYSGDSIKLMTKTQSLLSEFKQSRSDIKTFNFNPAIKVTHQDFFKQFKLSKSDLSQYSFIGVYAPYSTPNSGIVYSVKSATGTTTKLCDASVSVNDSLIPYNNKFVGNLTLSEEDTKKRKEGALKILSHFHVEMPNKTLWGNSGNAVISIGEADTIKNDNTETLRTSESSYQGYYPELAVYSRTLTPFERNRVESYFAMKYGISLNHSYYLSDSTLIWDMSANLGYNNRITTAVCDNNSKLYQPISTTSYEETPYLSWLDNDTIDSYYLNNSESAPSKYRLLVQGKEFANRMTNGKYYIWGDNDLSTDLSDSTKRIYRNWIIQTNNPDVKPNEIQNVWTGNGISIYNKGFTNSLIQDSQETVTAVSEVLSNGEGAISFTYKRLKGTYDIGFVSDKSATQCEIGYRFTPLGSIYLVINGNTYKSILSSQLINEIPVKIFKYANKIILQIEGIGYHTYYIDNSSDNYYGFVSMNYNSNYGLFSIDNIRIDGIYDNGNQLELGYINLDNSIYDYKENTYLIIDRSGTGDFLEENLEYHKTSGYDKRREKILFNNIYWDIDGSGTDVFSFGCVDCLQAEVTTTNATMGDSVSNNDGSINIKIKAGMPAYYYNLYKISESDTTLSTLAHFSYDSISIEGLQSGMYKLDVGQMGGFDIYGTASQNENKRIARTNNTVTSGELSWIIPEDNQSSVYDVGFGTSQTVNYGYRVIENNLYFITPGGLQSYGNVTPGILISAIYAGNFITFSIENQQVYRVYNVSGSMYGLVEALHGDCHVQSFRLTGTSSMNTTAGMYADYYENCNITKYVEIMNFDIENMSLLSRSNISPKSKFEISGVEDVNSTDAEFIVFTKDSKNFTAVLNLNMLSPATLVVFDASGKFVLSKDFSDASNQRELLFSVPAPGVYIVKAITYSREFTQKIISK